MKYLIIDGNYMLHRVLYSGSYADGLSNDEGVRTGGCYGVLKMLHKLIDRFPSDVCIYVWDGGISKRRLDIYNNYKRRLEPADEDSKEHYNIFMDQQRMLDDIFSYLCVKSVRVRYREGDDVCYFLSKYLKGDKVIVSDDRDYILMISESTSVYRAMADEFVDYDNCQRVTGFTTDGYMLYKSVCGDASDNIKGVQGVGEVTVKSLIDRNNGVESFSGSKSSKVMSFLESLKEEDLSTRESKILKNLDQIKVNMSLIDLDNESLNEEEGLEVLSTVFKPIYFNQSELFEALRRLDFNSIMEKYSTWIKPFMSLSGKG